MDTTITNGKSQEESNNPIMLAKRAQREIIQTGYTNIKCPKCDTPPELTMTPRGERTIVSCDCGYVHNVEINLLVNCKGLSVPRSNQ